MKWPLIKHPAEMRRVTNLIEAFCKKRKLCILTNIEIGDNVLIEISGPVDERDFDNYLHSVGLTYIGDILPGFNSPHSLECNIKLV